MTTSTPDITTTSPLKVLLLVQDKQRAILDELYASIAQHCDCDIRRLSSDEQENLKRYFKTQIDTQQYDRIVLILRMKKVMKQARFCRTLSNLVFLEHDACQNYISESKYYGRFSRFYRKVPYVRIICSGFGVSRKLCAEGFDACFVPKGYDDTLIQDLQQTRDIPLGFIGTLNNRVYRQRGDFLTKLAHEIPLNVMQTASGADYVQMLNRIRYFISADINFGEYMIKNFEAMAAGCILFAWDQGEEENRALGFRDMENLVLYRSQEELLKKWQQLEADPVLAERIRQAGKALAHESYAFRKLGRAVVTCLTPLPLINKNF